ncbi:MAG: glycerol-3-phosphate 1-O-acyltransferase PlsY [Eubacteriales bacterium]|nr:glycerol-3-phosphate 1-O-acyltransferase PlsY [Eubacteriales bacterium]
MDISLLGLLLVVVVIISAYLIGNIVPAIIIGKIYGIDIKHEGSGNAGTTNALRVLGKKAAIITLLIDIAKGIFAVNLGYLAAYSWIIEGWWQANLPFICAVSVFVGHIWPVFFKFKGGKGVATAFGAITAISPLLGFSLLGIVALIVLITKRMSAGSVLGAMSAPILAWMLTPQFLPGIFVMVLIIIYKHKSNIHRLLKGEEPKLNFKK